jgi:hypothetical protein
MRLHAALDALIESEERVARLYTDFYGRFAHMPAVAGIWWEMALEEHEHAGVLKMVRQLVDPRSRVADVRGRLRPVQEAIQACERAATRQLALPEALAMAVRLERSELDRLGQETLKAVGGGDLHLPTAAFAPHAAHLARLMRTVRKFGGEDVARDAWDLDSGGRGRGAVAATRGPSASAQPAPPPPRRRRVTRRQTVTRSRPPGARGAGPRG